MVERVGAAAARVARDTSTVDWARYDAPPTRRAKAAPLDVRASNLDPEAGAKAAFVIGGATVDGRESTTAKQMSEWAGRLEYSGTPAHDNAGDHVSSLQRGVPKNEILRFVASLLRSALPLHRNQRDVAAGAEYRDQRSSRRATDPLDPRKRLHNDISLLWARQIG